MKPSPLKIQELYLESLRAFGIDPLEHDIRFVKDDWECRRGSMGVGPGGLAGWHGDNPVYLFPTGGGIDLNPVCVEITYGIERIAMYLQEIDNVDDLEWACGIKDGDVHHRSEVEFSTYNFEVADIDMLRKFFDMYESEAISVAEKGLVFPAYDYCLKCSHTFNLLDARGAISVAERTNYIARVRNLAKLSAENI